MYAEAVISKIDNNNHVSKRLFRDSCAVYKKGYVKDLAKLGRDLKDVVIVDNNPSAFMF